MQTVILGRRSDGAFGVVVSGGLEEQVLPYVSEVYDDCKLVAYTERPLLKVCGTISTFCYCFFPYRLAFSFPFSEEASSTNCLMDSIAYSLLG